MQENLKEYQQKLQEPIINENKTLVYIFTFTDREDRGTFSIEDKEFDKLYHGFFKLSLAEDECRFRLDAKDFAIRNESGLTRFLEDEFETLLNYLKTGIVPLKPSEAEEV